MTQAAPKSARRSALPRAIDLSYPSNRYAAGGFVVAIALAKVLGHRPAQAIGVGLAGFAAWATARELDPDHPGSAATALPLGAGAALLGGVPNPLASFSALSSVRVLAATVGHAPTQMDTLALAAQSVLAGLMGERVAAALPGKALGLSALEQDQFSADLSSSVMAASALLPNLHRVHRHSVVSDVLTLAALGTFGVLDRPEGILSKCDQTPHKVADQRVQRARQLALGGLAASLLLRQTRSLTPLASAVLGVGLRRASR